MKTSDNHEVNSEAIHAKFFKGFFYEISEEILGTFFKNVTWEYDTLPVTLPGISIHTFRDSIRHFSRDVIGFLVGFPLIEYPGIF